MGQRGKKERKRKKEEISFYFLLWRSSEAPISTPALFSLGGVFIPANRASRPTWPATKEHNGRKTPTGSEFLQTSTRI